jgi:hypothetical protein
MLGLGLGLNVNKQLQGFETLVKSAGGVLYYDARKDLIQANGVTPDRSGKGNDITWANFAGTGTSGLVIENGKVFRRLDGTDDYGSVVNTASIDITSAPLGVFQTFRVPASVGAGGYFLTKNDVTGIDHQYALANATNIVGYLEGIGRGNIPYERDVFLNIGFIWDSTTVKYYKNIVNGGSNGAYSGALTSRPNTRIGCRGNNSAFIQYDLATSTLYTGPSAVESKILKAESSISKAYIGG